MIKLSAVIPAAGRGRRMGSRKAKPYLMLGEKPILAHTLLALEKIPEIAEVIVVVSKVDRPVCQSKIIDKYKLKKVKKIIEGGRSRAQSVYRGLKEIDLQYGLVLIHDGIRPFITRDIVKRVTRQAVDFGAAISAIPVDSTIKEADRNLLVKYTLFRDRLWLVQTPQVFRSDLIWQAYTSAGDSKRMSWDDAGLVEAIGRQVKLVRGEADNIKITTPQDLLLAELILRRRNRTTE